MTLVLGCDPGTHVAGYAVVSYEPRPQYFGCGVIRAPISGTPAERIGIIVDGFISLLDEAKPVLLAIERAHVRYPGAALPLAELRGAIREAARQRGIRTAEYQPAEWRRLAFGVGGVKKRETADRITRMFGLVSTPQQDACDALGIAVAATREIIA
jgi:crossover junction endodeoxyribonuclease RuvC